MQVFYLLLLLNYVCLGGNVRIKKISYNENIDLII